MSRRRYRGGRTGSAKAGVMPSDVDMLAGTLADLSARQIGDSEIYWRLYRTHPWVRACVDLIGNAVAQEGYDIAPIDDTDEIQDDPRVAQLRAFFRIAFIGKYNTFRRAMKALVVDQQTYGVAYLRRRYGRQDGSKTLVALERLNARYVVPHLAQDRKSIDYFVLLPVRQESGSAVQEAANQISIINGQTGERIAPEEIVMISIDCGGDAILPSPSPLEALDLTAATDLNVRRHRNSVFENGATVGNVLACANATDDQVRDAQKKLSLHHVGSRRAYKNMAIGGDWKLLNLMQSGKNDVDFVKGSQIAMEEICAVYKVPPSKLRDVSGSMGQAGKGEDDEAFEQECILPIEECLYEALTLEVLQKDFQIEDLELVPSRRNKLRLEVFAAAVNGSKIGMTGNELRDMIRLPKSDVAGMDTPLFLGATGQGVAADEPTPPQEPTPTGDVTDPDEVGENAAKGKGWY